MTKKGYCDLRYYLQQFDDSRIKAGVRGKGFNHLNLNQCSGQNRNDIEIKFGSVEVKAKFETYALCEVSWDVPCHIIWTASIVLKKTEKKSNVVGCIHPLLDLEGCLY